MPPSCTSHLPMQLCSAVQACYRVQLDIGLRTPHADTKQSASLLTPQVLSFARATLTPQSCCLPQTGLERLAFQNVGCSIKACQAVSRLTKHLTSLRSMRLHNNMSDDEGAVAIAQVRSAELVQLEYLAPKQHVSEGELIPILCLAWSTDLARKTLVLWKWT